VLIGLFLLAAVGAYALVATASDSGLSR
jgi:hypothetical protein